MYIFEVLTITFAVISILAGVSWGVLFTRGRKLWAGLKELRDDYLEAKIDGTITNEERLEIADDLITIIDHASNIWMVLENLLYTIGGIVRKKR